MEQEKWVCFACRAIFAAYFFYTHIMATEVGLTYIILWKTMVVEIYQDFVVAFNRVRYKNIKTNINNFLSADNRSSVIHKQEIRFFDHLHTDINLQPSEFLFFISLSLSLSLSLFFKAIKYWQNIVYSICVCNFITLRVYNHLFSNAFSN